MQPTFRSLSLLIRVKDKSEKIKKGTKTKVFLAAAVNKHIRKSCPQILKTLIKYEHLTTKFKGNFLYIYRKFIYLQFYKEKRMTFQTKLILI